MKITEIKSQIKNVDRFSVYIDSKYEFSLSLNALVESKIKLGDEISAERLEELKMKSVADKALNNALRYVSIRPRSEDEIRQYLMRKKVSKSDLIEAIDELKKMGYVNDESFAASWVESRRLLKGSSKIKISAELRQKRVDSQIIDKVLGDYDDLSQLVKLIEKKRSIPKFVNNPEKLLAYLARQGFRYDDISQVMRIIDEGSQ